MEGVMDGTTCDIGFMADPSAIMLLCHLNVKPGSSYLDP